MILDRHLDLLPLLSGELELAFPSPELVESFAANSRHPLVQEQFPQYYDMTNAELLTWIEKIGGGRHWAGKPRGPVYWLWLVLQRDGASQVIGNLEIRISQSEPALMGSGHVGYHVLPQFRCQNWMTKALNLAQPLFAAHGFEEYIITIAPENLASRRVAEKAGGELLEIRTYSPEEKQAFNLGVPQHCRYRVPVQ